MVGIGITRLPSQSSETGLKGDIFLEYCSPGCVGCQVDRDDDFSACGCCLGQHHHAVLIGVDEFVGIACDGAVGAVEHGCAAAGRGFVCPVRFAYSHGAFVVDTFHGDALHL